MINSRIIVEWGSFFYKRGCFKGTIPDTYVNSTYRYSFSPCATSLCNSGEGKDSNPALYTWPAKELLRAYKAGIEFSKNKTATKKPATMKITTTEPTTTEPTTTEPPETEPTTMVSTTTVPITTKSTTMNLPDTTTMMGPNGPLPVPNGPSQGTSWPMMGSIDEKDRYQIYGTSV